MMDQGCVQNISLVRVTGLLQRRKNKKLMADAYPQLDVIPGLSFCFNSKLKLINFCNIQ